MARYFKGKQFNYHTEITITKGEQIVIWISSLLLILFVALCIKFIESFFLTVITILLAFIIEFFILFCILFRKNHEEERIENSTIMR